MEYNNYEDDFESDFDFKAFIVKYLRHWKWFALSAAVCLLVAFIYLRYTVPQYQAQTTILVKDEKKGGMLSELSAFADMGIGGGMKSNLDNEIEILKSRTLVQNVVKSLNLTVRIAEKGNVVDRELYAQAPVEVVILDANGDLYKNSLNFNFTATAADSFTLEENAVDSGAKALLNGNSYKYEQQIATRYGKFLIRKTKYNTAYFKGQEQTITVSINPLEKVAAGYKNGLQIEPLSETSSVVAISVTGPVREKSENFLNTLVAMYNDDAAADKNFISENTSKFIASRLALITEELDGVEQDVEGFKKSNKITDVAAEAAIFVEGSNEYDKKGVETEIQLNVVSSMLGFIKKSDNSDLLPTNILTADGDASGLISSYNELVLNRNRILKSATVLNPSVIQLDQQISSLRSTVQTSLMRMQSSLNIQKRNLSNQEGILNSKINKIPVQERQFRAIARQQKVKEELYLYLLQKREETAISLSATEPNARVIDTAKADDIAVAPKKKIVYLAGLLLGLLIPFGVIYIDDVLDTKIKSRLDLDGKTTIPFIGDVPTSDTPNELVKSDSRTSFAEAIRIIRTNLEFMLNRVPEGTAKTLFLTSTFPKEGKTFISVNLAATFALSGKKVLLVGMDVRNPKLQNYLNLPERGLTNYLSSKDLAIDDLIIKFPGYEDFSVLPAGIIPPNPAELLMNKKVDSLFADLKSRYDYIIVDTAPVSLVTDTLLIAKHADCFIYVARANFLEKRMLDIANNLYKEGKLPNMCMLLNDTDSTKGYGYGYGYGHEVQKKPWYKLKG
ncbi:polysaccharide biosynthesis tyrosine autokinase [Flavobacterium sp. 14A]|uniref:GumC family protein n=1 Tax=Flavobacterium sp. 14A TaxID=2735896 RepID=UPI00156DA1BD|nr:polysaccharide biosynthesis tyrosine autokinase [Flavobacterium sp. 14A]NRT13287.1 capsular exopolysaccharide synthesis family protein [Flavobacterium sp. 14A]